MSANTTLAPDVAPTDTVSVHVFSSTDFKGQLQGDPATGVVRVTDAHPAGTYPIAVQAFDSSGGSTSTTRYSLLLLILIDSDLSIGVIEYEATIPYTRFFILPFGVI